MGWDQQGRYYTRSRRVNGRVVREYVGGGELGRLAAELDMILRGGRRLAAAQRLRLRGREDRAQALLDEVARGAALLAEAALLAAGYHQHKGQWRRRRTMNEGLHPAAKARAICPALAADDGGQAFVKAARAGDERALEAVRSLLTIPGAVETFGGDLARTSDR
jgi:hypothetical protein